MVTVNVNIINLVISSSRKKEQRTYINSKDFMLHFERSFYFILKQLEQPSLINSAKVFPPKMICRAERDDCFSYAEHQSSNDDSIVKESWQDFLPSISVPFWPDEAIEWYLRSPKERKVQRYTCNMVKFCQWPNTMVFYSTYMCHIFVIYACFIWFLGIM